MERNSVVVIDPDQQWARELGYALEDQQQFNVLPPVHNGSEALDHIQNNRPGVIILELLLDDYDGLYLLNHIHEHLDGYTPLVYILTALPLRHLALPHQAITRLWDRIYIARKPQLSQCVIENICHLTQLLPKSSRPVIPDVDARIDMFLFKLDHRFHLKRATAASTALKILFLEEDPVKSMGALYTKTAERIGGTASGVERNLRSYRGSVKESATDFYRANLAQYNINNAEFYWNALRVLKQEMR